MPGRRGSGLGQNAPQEWKKCDVCEGKFPRRVGEVRKSDRQWRTQRFCSRECAAFARRDRMCAFGDCPNRVPNWMKGDNCVEHTEM